MKQASHHAHRHTHHFSVSYPVSLSQRLYTIVLGPLAIVAIVGLIFRIVPPLEQSTGVVTFSTILLAVVATLLRIVAAYVLAVVVAIPTALLIERNRTFETVLMPIFDVLQSIPNLALLPALVVLFGSFGFLDGAAIVILFLNIVWNVTFAVVGGLQVIPHDVVDAARTFGLSGWEYVRRLTLPAIFPQFVTGSIIGVASAWNIIIVAEAIHAYIPGGTSAQDLFGIGSILVSSSENGQSAVYVAAFAAMVAVIALFNFFVWQKLLHYAQKFRFE